jgi:hypothetical protein
MVEQPDGGVLFSLWERLHHHSRLATTVGRAHRALSLLLVRNFRTGRLSSCLVGTPLSPMRGSYEVREGCGMAQC